MMIQMKKSTECSYRTKCDIVQILKNNHFSYQNIEKLQEHLNNISIQQVSNSFFIYKNSVFVFVKFSSQKNQMLLNRLNLQKSNVWSKKFQRSLLQMQQKKLLIPYFKLMKPV